MNQNEEELASLIGKENAKSVMNAIKDGNNDIALQLLNSKLIMSRDLRQEIFRKAMENIGDEEAQKDFIKNINKLGVITDISRIEDLTKEQKKALKEKRKNVLKRRLTEAIKVGIPVTIAGGLLTMNLGSGLTLGMAAAAERILIPTIIDRVRQHKLQNISNILNNKENYEDKEHTEEKITDLEKKQNELLTRLGIKLEEKDNKTDETSLTVSEKKSFWNRIKDGFKGLKDNISKMFKPKEKSKNKQKTNEVATAEGDTVTTETDNEKKDVRKSFTENLDGGEVARAASNENHENNNSNRTTEETKKEEEVK